MSVINSVVNKFFNTSSIDKIIERFPYPILPKRNGEPSYASIADLNKKLNANAASVYYNLGCDALGHFWLTLKPEIYNTPTATPFEPPASHRPPKS